MKTTQTKPSDLIDWTNVDKTKVRDEDKSFHPEWYGWYLFTPTGFKSDEIFLPHRKPTVDEICNNNFI